jgi:hypothetical protein
MNAPPTAKLNELSSLLGVEIVAVTRDKPAHERMEVTLAEGGWVRRPARELDGETIAREYWHVRIEADFQPLYLRLTSDQVRDGRRLTALLRRLGSDRTINNREARAVLRVMHEVAEATR